MQRNWSLGYSYPVLSVSFSPDFGCVSQLQLQANHNLVIGENHRDSYQRHPVYQKAYQKVAPGLDFAWIFLEILKILSQLTKSGLSLAN